MDINKELIDSLIEQEAKRILKILLKIHKLSIKVDKPFYKLVKEIMKKEYNSIYIKILIEITENIPMNLIVSNIEGKVFITVHEFENRILYKKNYRAQLKK